jgi:hypothetical protein
MTNELTNRSAAKKEKDILYLISLPMRELRHRQDRINIQKQIVHKGYTDDKESEYQHIRDGADDKWMPVYERLDLMYWDLLEAINRKCFPQKYPSPQSSGKKKK